ncbi:MAG TPA: vWA domain-containing protein [Polyangiaceae bacterium]
MVGHRASLSAGVLAGTALLVACGSESMPPVLGGAAGNDAGAPSDGGPSLISDASPVIKDCGVGPDGGVCACVDQPLVVDPPTLYFVLDRSGSMADLNKWNTVRTVLETVTVRLGGRAAFGAAVFPDPTADGCAVGRQVVPPRVGDGLNAQPGPDDLALFYTLNHIGASGGTPTAATLKALLPQLQAIKGKTYVILATDGGPNCNANASCSAAMCTWNIEGDNGCSPAADAGDCCTAPNNLACLDAQPTIDAVGAIAAAGIPVYVVGVPGSEPYASLLDQLATTGGTARSSEPLYYAVSTADEQALLSAMSQIAAKVTGSCTLMLDQAPPDSSLVNVFLDGSAIAQSGPDGWTLNGTTVTILGKSCQAILDGDVLDVRVVAGCPTLTH